MSSFNLLAHIRGLDDNVVVWMLNIGIEREWNESKSFVMNSKEDIVVNHIEELNILLARKQDYLILREKPTKIFIEQLRENGFDIPHFLFPKFKDETKSITELVLEDTNLIRRIKRLSCRKKLFFVPYGISRKEELFAKLCGLTLLGGTAEKSILINNKIFSKKVAKDLLFPMADGIICKSIEDILHAYDELKSSYPAIIVKMPCNSSGQGLWIVENEKKLRLVIQIVNRLMNTQRISEWLVEGWIEKKVDLNFQVYVAENGEVETFSVKEQIVKGTLYVGSVMPARITKDQEKKCIEYGNAIGRYLFDNGFTGVFGIDALISKEDVIVPIIEINGRFTLSSYISFVRDKYPNKKIYAFFERFKAVERFNYKELLIKMKELKILFNGEEGVFIYNSASLDAKRGNGIVRAFAMAIGDDYFKASEYAKRFVNICNAFKLNCSEE